MAARVIPDELVACAQRQRSSPRAPSPELERAFRAEMRPEIAAWTVAYHGVAVALQAAALAYATVAEGGAPWAGGARSSPGGFVWAHLALWAALSALWLADRGRRLPWDAIGAGSAALVCAVHPWIGRWAAPHSLWSRSPEEAERSAVFCTAALSAGFAAYVPVHMSRWVAVSLSSILSYALLAGTLGAQDPQCLPILLGTLALPLLALAGNLRSRALHTRSAWLAGAQRPADIAFFLSEDGRLLRTTAMVHDHFFGCRAEALCFGTLLPPAQQSRLQALLKEVSGSAAAGLLEPCTLCLPHGRVEGSLRVALLAASQRGGDGARFHVGLRVVEEAPLWPTPPERDAPELPPEPERRGSRPHILLRLPVVPAAPRLPVVPSAPPGAGPASSVSRSRSGNLSQPGSEAGRLSQPGSEAGRSRHSQAYTSQAYTSQAYTSQAAAWDSERDAPQRSTFGTRGRQSESGTLWLSESSCRLGRVPLRTSAAQTEAPQRSDAGANTTVAMDGFSFRCAACSKPPAPPLYSPDGCAPVVPGPKARALIEKLDRQRGLVRSRSLSSEPSVSRCQSEPAMRLGEAPRPNQEPRDSCTSRVFDGVWAAHPKDAGVCQDWLRQFQISAGRVVLGDGLKTRLYQLGSGGPVQLIGGEVRVQTGGRLFRQGRSGRVIEFVLMGPPEGSIGFDSDVEALPHDGTGQGPIGQGPIL